MDSDSELDSAYHALQKDFPCLLKLSTACAVIVDGDAVVLQEGTWMDLEQRGKDGHIHGTNFGLESTNYQFDNLGPGIIDKERSESMIPKGMPVTQVYLIPETCFLEILAQEAEESNKQAKPARPPWFGPGWVSDSD